MKECCCTMNRDGTWTEHMCPIHAGTDPCLTIARVTGKRRKGTIKNGKCTNCGWKEQQ